MNNNNRNNNNRNKNQISNPKPQQVQQVQQNNSNLQQVQQVQQNNSNLQQVQQVQQNNPKPQQVKQNNPKPQQVKQNNPKPQQVKNDTILNLQKLKEPKLNQSKTQIQMEKPPQKKPTVTERIENLDLPSLPNPIIPLTEIKDKVSSILKPKKETKKKRKKTVKKLTYDDLKINYKDENIFGKTFSKKAKHLKCAIDFLTLHQYLNRRGKIKDKEYGFIKKRYIWQYIYYLRINNKKVEMFQKYLGLGHKIKAIQLYKMIKEETGGNMSNKSVSKKEINLFINKLFRKNLDLNIPFLEYYVMNNRKKYNKKDNETKQSRSKVQTVPTKLKIELVTDKGKVKNDFNNANIGIKLNAKLEKID